MRCWMGLCFALLLPYLGWSVTAIPSYTVFYLPAQDGKPAQPYIEFYWQVDGNSVSFNKNANGHWISRIKTWIEIKHDTAGVVGSSKYVLQTTPAATMQAALYQNIMDLQRYTVPYGKIHISLKMAEEGKEDAPFVYEDSFTIDKQPVVFYSKPQVLDTFYKIDLLDNPFVRNGNMQIPLCINFLDEHRAYLNYYTELQGTDKIDANGETLIQLAYISRKAFDFPLLQLTRVDTLKPMQVVPVTGKFKVDALPSGNFHLNVVLKNSKGTELAKSATFFQRSNPHPYIPKDTSTAKVPDSILFEKVSVFDLSKTFVGKYSVAQLKAILKMIAPISNETELLTINAFIKKPDEMHMRFFVYNYWKDHSQLNPEDGWDEYTKKVREVNKMFGSGSKPGYETDRGFYYLKYGPPDQRYVVTNEEGAWPYEVWHYNAPGRQSSQGAFLFYNAGFMVNEYQLLHSTIMGEMRNTNWRANLFKTGVSTNNLNSRAEQILQNR